MTPPWAVELVGGPYDGATDLGLDVERPPSAIFAFRCEGEWCGGLFVRNGRHHAHVWVAPTDGDWSERRPPRTVTYVLVRAEGAPDARSLGKAVYGRGDFEPLSQARAVERQPTEAGHLAYGAGGFPTRELVDRRCDGRGVRVRRDVGGGSAPTGGDHHLRGDDDLGRVRVGARDVEA